WVKTNDSGNSDWNPYVTKGDAAYGLKHHRTNKIEFAIYTGTFHVAVFAVDSSFNGLWHHLAGTYDGSEVRLYIDGKLEVASPAAGSIATNTFNLNIGRTFEIPDWLYSGSIDDVRIYDYALSGDEIEQLVCTDPPPGDVNGDCEVDFLDLAIVMSNWLRCELPAQELCGQ
ncbi:MAG: LamG domain-containing protein, partial [Phycisphaerales bacterium]